MTLQNPEGSPHVKRPLMVNVLTLQDPEGSRDDVCEGLAHCNGLAMPYAMKVDVMTRKF